MRQGAVERPWDRLKRETWQEFSDRHGDWGRDAARYLGRRYGCLTLAQLGALAGGMDYAAVGQAVSRFARRLEHDSGLRKTITKLCSRNVKC